MPAIDLTRFEDVHGDQEQADAEIQAGRKRSHWMWYIFPQASGLGQSATSRRFAIESVDEALAFLTHATLGRDYVRIVDEVWRQVVEMGVSVHALFGSPDDAKLVSSLTLFSGVARRFTLSTPVPSTFVTRVEEILRAAEEQGLPRCRTTEEFLERQPAD